MRDSRESTTMTLALARSTQRTRARYDRMARVFDRMEARVEARMFSAWRARLWAHAYGSRLLEIGVGTGKNFPYYPKDAAITAIDLSPRMLEQARGRAQRDGIAVALQEGDAQALAFDDDCFDTVAATFVFCSVPDPLLGLREARRVLVPGGRLLLLEHELSRNRLLRLVMRTLNPLVVRLTGANINRETVRNVERAGLRVCRVDDLWHGIVKLIEAERPIEEPPASA